MPRYLDHDYRYLTFTMIVTLAVLRVTPGDP